MLTVVRIKKTDCKLDKTMNIAERSHVLGFPSVLRAKTKKWRFRHAKSEIKNTSANDGRNHSLYCSVSSHSQSEDWDMLLSHTIQTNCKYIHSIYRKLMNLNNYSQFREGSLAYDKYAIQIQNTRK
jgi:hypothetical protein